MIINNRDFFDGIYLTTQPDVVDGTRCMHPEPPLFPAVEYEGRRVYVVRVWRSKQLLDDDQALPIETVAWERAKCGIVRNVAINLDGYR